MLIYIEILLCEVNVVNRISVFVGVNITSFFMRHNSFRFNSV